MSLKITFKLFTTLVLIFVWNRFFFFFPHFLKGGGGGDGGGVKYLRIFWGINGGVTRDSLAFQIFNIICIISRWDFI